MAEVRLVDIYEPTAFNAAAQEAAIELNALLSSGILVRDPRIDTMVEVGGMVGELPNFNPLTNDEPDYTTDDPGVDSTPAKIDSATQIYRLANQHKSWSTMDLARQLALADPLGAITNRIGLYWATNTQQRVISSALGVMADNITNDAADMVIDVPTLETGASPSADKLIHADAVIDAVATLGDHAGKIKAIGLHSVVYTTLQKLNLIAYIPDARGEVNIPTYLGLRVLVDDSLPVRAGVTSGFVYTSILFGEGAFGYGTTAPLTASELERNEAAGNGGGQDILHSRFNEIVHPQGFAYNSATAGAAGALLQGISASRAHLVDGPKWDRVYTERKNIPLAFLRTNG
jgi:hypothetical protein